MNTDPIEQLRRLVEARAEATAGEWRQSGRTPCRANTPDGTITAAWFSNRDESVAQRAENTIAFIALAGSIDLPAILAAWEADRAELKKLSTPDMWWDKESPEDFIGSPDDLLDRYHGVRTGTVVNLMAAKSLPDRRFKFIDGPDGEQEIVEVATDEQHALAALDKEAP